MSAGTRRYYRGHDLVAMRDVAGATTRYFHYDHQGTTQCLTDSTGAVTDRFACDAWGVPVKRTGNSINRQWYVGNFGYYRQVDRTLDYVRQRYLSVTIGRWAAPDPARYGMNWYNFVLNQPERYYDWSGTQTCGEEPPTCCTQANVDHYFKDVIGSHCINPLNQAPGVWEKCDDIKLQRSRCDPKSGSLAYIAAQMNRTAQNCVDACAGKTYPPNAPWAAAVACCYPAGSTEPKACETRCCKPNMRGNLGADACFNYCLLKHEENHITRDCKIKRPTGGPESFQIPYSECCAYRAELQCLYDLYRSRFGFGPLSALGGVIAQCTKSSQKECGS